MACGGQLGAGRYSTVRKATDRRTGATVALKRVQIFSIMDSKARGDCVNEVRSGAAKGGEGRALRRARAPLPQIDQIRAGSCEGHW